MMRYSGEFKLTNEGGLIIDVPIIRIATIDNVSNLRQCYSVTYCANWNISDNSFVSVASLSLR